MANTAEESLPFGDGPRWRVTDLPRVTVDACTAALRGRNLPEMPWWRRYFHSWQRFEPHDRAPTPARDDEVLLYGLTSVWNEDDVIYATVRNLFLQGVDQVFVIDDSSDDDTVTEARAAGAVVLRDDSDGVFIERRRTHRLTRLIDEQTAAAGRPVWWLVVDADEFPRGPGGATIREFLRTLPPTVETVGSRVLEHYPDSSSNPLPRCHPIDEIRHARWYNRPACAAGHWKHQLLRLNAPGERGFMPGRHAIAAPPERRPVVESTRSLLMHHFPLRARERTERKLRLSGAGTGRYRRSGDAFLIGRVNSRLRSLELAYADAYHRMPNPFPGEPRWSVAVSPWTELVDPAEAEPQHVEGKPL